MSVAIKEIDCLPKVCSYARLIRIPHTFFYSKDNFEANPKVCPLLHKLPTSPTKFYDLQYQKFLKSLGRHHKCINYCPWSSLAYL